MHNVTATIQLQKKILDSSSLVWSVKYSHRSRSTSSRSSRDIEAHDSIVLKWGEGGREGGRDGGRESLSYLYSPLG